MTRGARRIVRASLRLVGPLIFVFLFWTTDLSSIAAVMSQGIAWMLAAAAGINLLIILIKAWRWRFLMKLQGVEYALSPLVRYYAIGAAVASWTPGRMGDFLRAVAIHRDRGLGLGKAASSVLADRLMDAATMATVALAGMLLLPGIAASHRVATGATGIAALGIAGWFLTRPRPIVRRRAGRVVGLIGAAREEIGEVLDGLGALGKPALLLPCTVTCAVTLLAFLQGFLVARGLAIDVGFLRLGTALAAASIASLLPVSVAGIGTREATLALLLTPIGIDMAEVLGFSVALLAIANGATALIGGVAWYLPAPRSWDARGGPPVDGDHSMPYNTPPRVGG